MLPASMPSAAGQRWDPAACSTSGRAAAAAPLCRPRLPPRRATAPAAAAGGAALSTSRASRDSGHPTFSISVNEAVLSLGRSAAQKRQVLNGVNLQVWRARMTADGWAAMRLGVWGARAARPARSAAGVPCGRRCGN